MTPARISGVLVVLIGLLLLGGIAAVAVHDGGNANTSTASAATTTSTSTSTSGSGSAPTTAGPATTSTSTVGGSTTRASTTATTVSGSTGTTLPGTGTGPDALAFTGATSNLALGLAMLALAGLARRGVLASRSR